MSNKSTQIPRPPPQSSILDTSECPWPFVIAGGVGSDLVCKNWDIIKNFLQSKLLTAKHLINYGAIVAEQNYNENWGPSEDTMLIDEAINSATYDNLNKLNVGLYGNLKIVNDNINTQHKQVRSTLESQHSTMMVSSFTAFLHSIIKRSNGRRLHVGLINSDYLTHSPA